MADGAEKLLPQKWGLCVPCYLKVTLIFMTPYRECSLSIKTQRSLFRGNLAAV